MSKNKSILILASIGIMLSLIVTPFLAKSRMTFYSFEILFPEEVNVEPGEEVTVEGGIIVTGFYWLHNFDLTVEGLPYEYELEPEWWEHVRILREWNPEQGVYRVPDKFSLKINVPEDASGSYIVTINGQEHHSFREVSNFTFFVLSVSGEPLKPQLTVSDILVPEEITEFEPFRMTFKINNEGPIDTVAKVAVVVPEDWEVDEPTVEMSLKKNESAAAAFDIIPTTTAGEVSLVVEYPFKQEIVKFTKTGPYLIPTGATTTTLPEEEKSVLSQIVGYATSVIDSINEAFEGLGSPYLTSVTIGIILVLLIIIFWLVLDIIRFTRKGRAKEPEETKETKTKISKAGAAEFDVILTEV